MLKKLAEWYKRRSKREKMILWGTALAMGILFSDRLVLAPALDKIASMDDRIHNEESAIRQSLMVLVQKDRISAEGKEFIAYSVEGKDPEKQMTALLKEIESLADHASVSLLYVKPANIKDEKETKKYLATLECEAEMEGVANFFYSIESSNKLLKIEKFQIQPKTQGSSIAHCTVTVSRTVLV